MADVVGPVIAEQQGTCSKGRAPGGSAPTPQIEGHDQRGQCQDEVIREMAGSTGAIAEERSDGGDDKNWGAVDGRNQGDEAGAEVDESETEGGSTAAISPGHRPLPIGR